MEKHSPWRLLMQAATYAMFTWWVYGYYVKSGRIGCAVVGVIFAFLTIAMLFFALRNWFQNRKHMKFDLKQLKIRANVLSSVALFVTFVWTTAPTEPQSKQYGTNPYIMIGVPATAAIAAWAMYCYCSFCSYRVEQRRG